MSDTNGETGAGDSPAPSARPADWWRTFDVPAHLPWYRRLELAVRMRFQPAFLRRRQPERFGPDRMGGFEVLDRVRALPISVWSYDFEPTIRHLGPMSQDFAAAFGLGDTNRMINPIDEAGVALVAIQALAHKVEQLEAEVAELKAQLAAQ